MPTLILAQADHAISTKCAAIAGIFAHIIGQQDVRRGQHFKAAIIAFPVLRILATFIAEINRLTLGRRQL